MTKYHKLNNVEHDVLPTKLFRDCEEKRAETILTALDGMSIVSATVLLDKCKQALMQSDFKFN